MGKNNLIRKETKIIHNGTTTIAYVTNTPKDGAELINAYEKLHLVSCEALYDTYFTKGIAKLCPEDEYNSSTGVLVASKKAHTASNKAMIKKLQRVLKENRRYVKLLQQTIDELETDIND